MKQFLQWLMVLSIFAAMPVLAQQEPCDPQIDYTAAGDTNMMLELYEAAAVNYSCAIDLQQDLFASYYRRARAYAAGQEFQLASADLTMMIGIDATQPFVYYYRGLVNRRMGSTDAALADFTHAIELAPDYARAYHGRALV